MTNEKTSRDRASTEKPATKERPRDPRQDVEDAFGQLLSAMQRLRPLLNGHDFHRAVDLVTQARAEMRALESLQQLDREAA